MSIDQEAHKLHEVLEERGIIGVIQHCLDNPTETLGVANTPINWGALRAVVQLLRSQGKPATYLHFLLSALADGTIMARTLISSEACPIEANDRLGIMRALDEVSWRLRGAADRAVKAARNE